MVGETDFFITSLTESLISMFSLNVLLFTLVACYLAVQLEAGRISSVSRPQRRASSVSEYEDITCDRFYGSPDSDACFELIHEIEERARNSRISIYTKVEFVAIGHESQYSTTNSYHTPLYWKSKSGQQLLRKRSCGRKLI